MQENNEEKKLLDLDLDPYPFSPDAFKFLKEQVLQHIRELVNESIRIAKRYRSDTVSTAHIERASEYLIYSVRRKIIRHVGTLGGIFLGSASSVFVSMWMNNQYTEKGVLFSAVLGIVGSVMITLHMSKD